MKIKEIMSKDCCFISHDTTVQHAAQKMAETDCGFIPVSKGEKLCGIVTDRDIALRAVAQNLGPNTPVSEIMSERVLYCLETDNVRDIADNMSENRVRRLVVLNNAKDKKLCGVVSICDIVSARKTESETASQLIKGVSRINDSKNNQSSEQSRRAA